MDGNIHRWCLINSLLILSVCHATLWAYNLRRPTVPAKHVLNTIYITVLFCSLLDPVFKERMGGDLNFWRKDGRGFLNYWRVSSGWRVVENPLHQGGDSEASTHPLLVAPDCAGNVDVHPLNLLINKLQHVHRTEHQSIVLFLRTSDPIYMGACIINHDKQIKMVAVGTCFRNNAAVIAPALGCNGPALSISAMLDSMDSQ